MEGEPGTKEHGMRASGFRETPDHENRGWPSGIPYIVGNEACERFGYYGMRAILYIHLVALFVLTGEVQERAKDLGTSTMHLFMTGVYALPMIGAIVSDRLWGKFRTILYLSLVYCLGYAVLSVFCDTLPGTYLGLALIAIGSGGIKPCVSANVGDQFGKGNWSKLRTVFQVFYFSVNFGSFFATIIIPRVREAYGPQIAFAIPGILMFVATLLFWIGREKFVHVPPNPGGRIGFLDTLSSVSLFMVVGHFFFTAASPGWIQLLASVIFLTLGLSLFRQRQILQPDDGFLAITLYSLSCFVLGDKSTAIGHGPVESSKDTLGLLKSRFWKPAVRRFGLEATEGPVAVFKIISIFVLISVFWALFDQHSSSWIRQAAMMDLSLWGNKKALPSEIPALNPLMVMILIPLINVVYSSLDKLGLRITPLRRMTTGMFLTSLSFVVVALIQERIMENGEGTLWFAWQIIPYLLITISEVLVSVTGLEFAYSQAPNRMKSTIMGFWLLSVALGNVLVALLARFGNLPMNRFFWLFAALMAAAGVLFGLRGYFYVPRDYTQN